MLWHWCNFLFRVVPQHYCWCKWPSRISAVILITIFHIIQVNRRSYSSSTNQNRIKIKLGHGQDATTLMIGYDVNSSSRAKIFWWSGHWPCAMMFDIVNSPQWWNWVTQHEHHIQLCKTKILWFGMLCKQKAAWQSQCSRACGVREAKRVLRGKLPHALKYSVLLYFFSLKIDYVI